MKGVMFSVAMLLVIIPIITVILLHSLVVSEQKKQLMVSIRISEMNELYSSIVRDFEKSSEVIVPRAVSSAISYVVTNGIGLDQADTRLRELVMNGTLYSLPESLMENNTFPVWVEKIKVVASQRGFTTSVVIQDLEIKPYDSWDIAVVANLTVNITEQNNTASLQRNVTIRKAVSILGFEDPIFPLNSMGRGTSIISKSPYWNNFTQNLITATGDNSWFYGTSVVIPSSYQVQIQSVQDKSKKVLVTDTVSGIESLANNFGAVVSESDVVGGITVPYVDNAANAMLLLPNNTNILVDGGNGKVWFIENLKRDIENSYYHTSLKGASFLDRLEGKLEVQGKYSSQTNLTIGLETFVNKVYLLSLDIPVDMNKVSVDHLYFSAGYYPGSRVKGLDEKFRIDQQLCTGNMPHSSIYGVSETLIS
ncbi:MAG: hypothetical protein HZA83_02780 [Thaumarchaeota archaeon]|nr:hypothetical protein [Nitrososphaerota archaeon]